MLHFSGLVREELIILLANNFCVVGFLHVCKNSLFLLNTINLNSFLYRPICNKYHRSIFVSLNMSCMYMCTFHYELNIILQVEVL